MKQLRYLGYVLLAYGAVMLILLFTPWKDWAANHSVAHLVSRTDRRYGNTVDDAVDMPLSVAGDVVVMFAGLWFAFYIPRMFQKYGMGLAPAATVAPTPPPPPGAPLPPPQL